MAPLILLLYNMVYGIICVSNFKKLKFLTEWNSIGIFNLPYVGRSLLWCIRFQRSVCCESAAPNNDIRLLSFINDLSKEG